jgi:hypothetical protein
MNPSSKDLRSHINSNPSAITETLVIATNLHIALMPDTPDLCVCLYDHPGQAPTPQIDGVVGMSYRYDKPNVQVIVRGNQNGYSDAYTLAEEIKELLRQIHNVEIASTRYIGVWASSDIADLGFDEKVRPIFSINFVVHRTTTT